VLCGVGLAWIAARHGAPALRGQRPSLQGHGRSLTDPSASQKDLRSRLPRLSRAVAPCLGRGDVALPCLVVAARDVAVVVLSRAEHPTTCRVQGTAAVSVRTQARSECLPSASSRRLLARARVPAGPITLTRAARRSHDVRP
jgi:hypothetical protein